MSTLTAQCLASPDPLELTVSMLLWAEKNLVRHQKVISAAWEAVVSHSSYFPPQPAVTWWMTAFSRSAYSLQNRQRFVYSPYISIARKPDCTALSTCLWLLCDSRTVDSPPWFQARARSARAITHLSIPPFSSRPAWFRATQSNARDFAS